MEGSVFSKEQVEELSNYSNEVIGILRRNDEQFTENRNGYIFDVSKLKKSTICELKSMTTKAATNGLGGISETETTPEIDNHQHVSKYSGEIANKVVSVSPKFLSEYNSDIQKLTAKPASMMKFLNAKKKYLRNLDQSYQKIDLKKDNF